MTPTASRISSSILVILAPLLLLAGVGVLSGSLDLGGTEDGALMVIWVVGLVWVWVIGPARARRARH